MKRTIERITRTAMLAVALMLCATSAWADETITSITAPATWGGTKPTAVWDGDFSSLTRIVGNVTYTLGGISVEGDAASNNTIQGDAGSGYYVQLNGTRGIKVTSTASPFAETSANSEPGFTAIMRYSNYANSGNSRTAMISFFNGNKDMLGLANDANKGRGIWDNHWWDDNRGITSSTVFPTSSSDNQTAVACRFLRDVTPCAYYVEYSDGTSVNGSFNGLTGGMDFDGVGFGGPSFTPDASKPLAMATGMKIHSIMIFQENLSNDDLGYWSLTGMGSMTIADGGTMPNANTTGVTINGGTVTISGMKTVAALFIQENTTLDFSGDATSRLDIRGPLYVADGKTLTIKLGALSNGYRRPIIMGSCFASNDHVKVQYTTPAGSVTSIIATSSSITVFTQTEAEAESQAQSTINYSRWSTSVNSVWTWTTPLTGSDTFIDAGGGSSSFTRFDTSTGTTAQTDAGPYAGNYQATSADDISPVSGDERSYLETYRDQQYNKYSLFWYYWCHTSDYTYYKLQGFYASPGRALRIAPDGEGPYHKMIGATFGPLTFGGMIVEPGANGYSIWTSRSNDSDRSSILGNPDGGTGDTWFEFRESLEFNRKGAFWIVGTVNFDVAPGKVVNLNAAQTSNNYHPIIYGSISQDNDETHSGGCLKMHGGGQIEAKNLTATGACLDYSDLSASRTAPYIYAELVVNSSTSYKFPALSGAATYQLANRLSDTSGITGDQTFSIGGHEYQAPLTFNDSDGTVNFPAVATLVGSETPIAWSAISWDAKPATIGSSDVVTLNVTGNTTLDIAAATSIKKLVLNIADGVELELTNISNLSSEDGIVLRGTGTLKIGSSTSLSALAIEDDVSISIADGGSITVSNNATVADGKTLTIGVPTYTTWGADGAKRIISATSFAGAVNFSGSTTPSGCHLEAKNDGIYLVNETAVDWRSFSINFYHDDNSKINTSSSLGLESIAGNYWNNVTGGVGTTTSLLGMSRGLTYSYVDPSLSVAVSNVQGSHHSTRYSSNTDLRRGFVHDHNGTYATPTVTFSNIPFDAYRVIVYHSTDSSNDNSTGYNQFGYDLINRKSFTYKDGVLDYGMTVWGNVDTSTPALSIAEGTNALISDITTGSTLTVVSHRSDNVPKARAGIAAIQIIKAYSATLSTVSNSFGTLFPSAASDGDYVVNVTADSPDTTSLTFGEAVTVRSLTLNIAEGKVLVVSGGSNLSASKVVVNGPGRLQLNSNETLPSLYVAEDATLGFAEEVGLTVTGAINVYSGKALSIAPAAMAAASRLLITASSIKGTLSVTAPTDAGNTYDISRTETTITLKRTVLDNFSFTGLNEASPTGWRTSWEYNGFGASTIMRIGPNETYPIVFETGSGNNSHPGGSLVKTTSFSVAVYADVSKMPSEEGNKYVMVSLGNGNGTNPFMVMYREGDYVRLGNWTGNGFSGNGMTAYVPVADGYHLYTASCNANTGTLALYRDAGTGENERSSCTPVENSITMPSSGSGLQIGCIWAGKPSTFYDGEGMALAAIKGYDVALTAEEVVNIADQFPATDGGKIYNTIEHSYGKTLNVYESEFVDGFELGLDKYFGLTHGTMNIPANNTVTVPFFKTMNNSWSGNAATLNLAGKLCVTSESTKPDVATDGGRGILLGNSGGTCTYNITGELSAPNAYMKTVHSAGQQTININGGKVSVKGLYAASTNSKINLTNGGVLEIADMTSETSNYIVNKEFARGTFRATSTTTQTKAIEFVGDSVANATTLDPCGHTFTMADGSMTGSGYITVASSAEGETKGSVVFGANASFGGKVILTDANRDLMDISAYKGGILYSGTKAETLAKLDGFGGTVYFTSNIDTSAVDLSGATVNVAENCTLTTDAGREGKLVLGSGAVVTLKVTTEIVNYEGHVPVVSGSGTVEYYNTDTSETVVGVDYVSGNNLLPYFNVWKASETPAENTISANAAARWRGEALPADNKNVAFYITNDTTLLVDATTSWGDVQVYGSGTLKFQSKDGGAISVSGTLQTTASTSITIESGITFTSGSELEIVSPTTPTLMSSINCGTELSPFSVPSVIGGGTLYLTDSAVVAIGSADLDTIYVAGSISVSGAASFGTLTVWDAGDMDIATGASVVATTATIAGAINVASTGSFIPESASGRGFVTFDGRLPTGTAWTTGSATTGWRGTVWIKNKSGLTNFTPQSYGNAYSVVRLTNIVGHLAKNNNCTVPVELYDDPDNSSNKALTIDNGWSSSESKFSVIKGSGTLKSTIVVTMNIRISDWSDFTGSIEVTGSRIIFGSGNPGYADNGTHLWQSIFISSGADVSVPAGKTWTTNLGIEIEGTFRVNEQTAFNGAFKFANGGKLVLNNSAVSITGNLMLPATGNITIDSGTIALGAEPVNLITGISNADSPDVTGVIVEGCTVSVGGSSGAYTICAKLNDGVWASGNGSWTEECFNGTSQSTDGKAVSFLESASSAVTVTLTGTRTPTSVTFNGGSGTTYTLGGGEFSPSGAVAIQSGTVIIESSVSGVTFNVASGATLKLSNASNVTVAGSGTLEIPRDGTVTLTNANTIDGIASLSGEGMLVMPSAALPGSLLQTLLKNANWKGTLSLSGLNGDATTQNFRMSNYGNDSSKIQFTNCIISYPVNDNNDSYGGKVVLSGSDALKFTVDNGYSNNKNLLGELAGTGTLTSTGSNTQLYMFKSSPEFSGNISTSGKRIMFVNEASDGTAKYADDSGAWVGTVRIAANASASIGASANWVAYNGFGIYGTLIVKGENSYLEHNNSGSKGIIFNNGATIRYDALATLRLGNTVLRTPTVVSGDTVKIAFGENVALVSGTKLISWGGIPEGSFAFDNGAGEPTEDKVVDGVRYVLVPKSDGLYLKARYGTIFSVW